MTEIEVITILDDFGKVWPKANEETINRGLYRRLFDFDFQAVRQAFDIIIAEGVPRSYLQTPWAAVLQKARLAGGVSKTGRISEPVLAYYICCFDHPVKSMPRRRIEFFFARPCNTPWDDIVTGQAERARQNVEDVYGGRWVIEPPEQEQHFADDGLRGQVAREPAERDILAGPDCAGKRWLLGRQAAAKKEPKPLPPKETLALLSHNKQQQAEAAKSKPRKVIEPDDIPF